MKERGDASVVTRAVGEDAGRDAMKGIPAEAPSICGTASASTGMRDTELPNPALNSAWSAGSLAQPGSVRFQGDSTPAAKGEVVVVPQSVDDGQVVKSVQVGETAVGTRKASSTASSMLFCGKTRMSRRRMSSACHSKSS